MAYTNPGVHHFREIRTTGNALNGGCFVNHDLEGWSVSYTHLTLPTKA